jgi:hypothetical protein
VQLWGICLARAHRCSSLSILLGLASDGIRTEDLLEDPGERRNLDCERGMGEEEKRRSMVWMLDQQRTVVALCNVRCARC